MGGKTDRKGCGDATFFGIVDTTDSDLSHHGFHIELSLRYYTRGMSERHSNLVSSIEIAVERIAIRRSNGTYRSGH